MSLDHATAMRLFRDAALQGHPQAATNLAYMLEHGQACTPDSSAAFAWYSAAAEGGERQGMHGAALMLYEARVPHYDEHERIADAFNVSAVQRLATTSVFAASPNLALRDASPVAAAVRASRGEAAPGILLLPGRPVRIWRPQASELHTGGQVVRGGVC